MASQAPNNLPLLYNDIQPIQRQVHGDKTFRRMERIKELGTTHAIPLTVDEFVLAQRWYPIVFSSGDNPVPLALMGLHEGTNIFFDGEGNLRQEGIYIPAYIRRYPFLLARLNEGSDQLSLCIDPVADILGDGEGDPLFVGDEPSPAVNDILAFCEQFEQAGQRTGAFMKELGDMGLLMEGEVAIQPEGLEQPFIYRGFQMVDEEKFRGLRGDELRKMNQSGMLGIIMAHLFSLPMIRDIFARQVEQGTGPIERIDGKPATVEA
ncbi:SapC family protein [Sphingomonas rhizophila]|uniref:SapC family protein n=1 Tax=Sphingomonas rhizophila TaxID=2071607 RepID=A0A7G9SCG3_9SPHN|nr:SapC family protein [Sphingomonas rhizophila]QNN65538.1 SapC family protein [Sphingomonas rhizophila]